MILWALVYYLGLDLFYLEDIGFVDLYLNMFDRRSAKVDYFAAF